MAKTHGSQPLVTIGGTRLPASTAALISEAIIESDLLSPSACRLAFTDRDATVLDEIGVQHGDDIEVHTSPVGEATSARVFVGTVAALEYRASERGGFSVIVAYDAGFILRQRRSITSFNDISDADVVNQVCSEAGVAVGIVEAGDVIHPYLAQVNESSWDFLARRAAANDCVMYVADGELHFRAAPDATSGPTTGDRGSSDPLQLAFGRNLTDLQVRTSIAGQIGEVEVRGWDPATKESVSSTATATSRSSATDATAESLGREFGTERRVIGLPGLSTEPECAAVAASAAEASAATMNYAEGRTPGEPRIVAGVAVSLGVTGRFDGQYTVSTARHIFDSDGYSTEFTISGEHDRTMFGLLSPTPERREFGLRPGIVTNVEDPSKLGKVKVKFPWLSDEFESNWSRVMQIGAGVDRGIFWYPEVDDEVLISFMDGDITFPVVMGGMYNGVDTAPLDGFEDPQDGSMDVRCIRTRAGHTIEFSDLAGEERIRITTGDESMMMLLDQANSKLVVSTTGDLEINADGNAAITSRGDLSIETNGAFSVSAQGGASVESSSGLKLASSGMVEVSGAMIKLN